jgi:FtsH-binding integral membrane protein
MSDQSTATASSPASEPTGMGGWLILPMIGLMAAPLFGLSHLSLPIKEPLPKLHVNFLYSGLVAYAVTSIVLPAGLLIIMFMKKRNFPRLYVAWALVNIVFVVLHLLAATFLFRATSLLDAILSGLWRGVGLYGVGIPYMRNSRRVRNTFIS